MKIVIDGIGVGLILGMILYGNSIGPNTYRKYPRCRAPDCSRTP